VLIGWAVGYLVNNTGYSKRIEHFQKSIIKLKHTPRIGHESPEGEYRYSSTLSLTSALDGMGGQRQAPAALPPGKTRYPLYVLLDGPQGRSGWVQLQNL
jgi:hypothetical protein